MLYCSILTKFEFALTLYLLKMIVHEWELAGELLSADIGRGVYGVYESRTKFVCQSI